MLRFRILYANVGYKNVFGGQVLRKCLGLLVAALFAATSAVADERVLRIAATEWPPFYGADLDGNGFMTEIIRTALDRNGYEADISFLPWSRALKSAQDGNHEALFTVWYREEREEWFLFSDALPSNELVFFHRSDMEIPSTDYGDLLDMTIGVVRGYAPPPGFEEAGLTVSISKDDEENLRMLDRGRVDLVLTDRIVAQHLLNTTLTEIAGDLTWTDPPVHVDVQYLVVSRQAEGAEAILADFNAGLAAITEDGTLNEIMTRYGF